MVDMGWVGVNVVLDRKVVVGGSAEVKIGVVVAGMKWVGSMTIEGGPVIVVVASIVVCGTVDVCTVAERTENKRKKYSTFHPIKLSSLLFSTKALHFLDPVLWSPYSGHVNPQI